MHRARAAVRPELLVRIACVGWRASETRGRSGREARPAERERVVRGASVRADPGTRDSLDDRGGGRRGTRGHSRNLSRSTSMVARCLHLSRRALCAHTDGALGVDEGDFQMWPALMTLQATRLWGKPLVCTRATHYCWFASHAKHALRSTSVILSAAVQRSYRLNGKPIFRPSILSPSMS